MPAPSSSSEKADEVQDHDGHQDEGDDRTRELPGSRARAFPLSSHQLQDGFDPGERHGDGETGLPWPAALPEQIRRVIPDQELYTVNPVQSEACP